MCAPESDCRVGVRPMIHCQRQVSFCSTRILRRSFLPSRRLTASRLAALAAERLADVFVGALAAFPAATANTVTATAGQALVTCIEPPGSGARTRRGRWRRRPTGGAGATLGRPNRPPASLVVSFGGAMYQTHKRARTVDASPVTNSAQVRDRLRFVTV